MKNAIIFFIMLFIFSNYQIAQKDVSFYSEGMKNFYDGNYSLAIKNLNLYLSQSEVDENLFSSAKLYIGESLLGLDQYDGAITNFEEFVEKYPNSNLREIALYRLGNLYFNKKIYDKSREFLTILVNKYPTSEYSGSAFHLIGETFIEENDLNKAEQFFNSAVNSKYNNTFVDRSIFALANVYEKKGEYRKAVEYYDKLLGFHRNSELSSQAQFRIGVCYFELKEYDNVILELSDPLIEELNSDDKNNADYILANSYYRLKEYNNASEAYKRILNNSPTEDMLNKIRYGLAWINFQQNDFDSAYKLFNLLSTSKDDSIAIKSLYWSGEAQRYAGNNDEAIAIHKKFAEKYPNHYLTQRVKLNIGISKFSEKSFDESETSLLQSLNSSDPFTRSKSYTLLGEISLRRKEYQKAKEYFQYGLNISQIPVQLKDRCFLGLGVSNFYLKNNVEALKNFNSINENETEIEKNKLFFYRAEANFVLGNYNKSIADYNKVNIENNEFKDDVVYGLAYSYFDLPDFSKAAYYFNEFNKNYSSDSRFSECQLRLADCYYAQKDYSKASTYYQRALINSAKFGNDERAFFNYAQSLFKSGDAQNAIDVLNQIQIKFPASNYADDSQYLIGWIKFQRNEFDAAIENYSALFEKYPQSNLLPIALYSIGDSHFNKGEYDKAVLYYNRVISQYPNTQYVYDAVNGIQYCYVVQDKQPEAVNYLQNFIADHPSLDFLDKIQMKTGEIYYSAGQYEQAISEYEKVVKNYPQSSQIPQAYYWMGKSAALSNNTDKAIQYFEYVKNNSLNSDEGFSAVLEIGTIYRNQKNLNAEIGLYNEILGKVKDSKRISEIKFNKAQAYISSEQIPEAYKELQEIVDSRDGSLFYHKAEIELGILELSRNNFENSMNLFRDVSDNRKDDIAAEALYYVGQNYYMQKKIPEAITELIKLRSVYTMYEEWYTKSLLLLGDCYVANNDKVKAAEMYKAVLKRHKKNQFAQEANEKLNQL
ncbi:MAG: tetratricopeptide repeat protein [Ignavibacteriae bacterium]|jgi:TolA-binding protein|nr:tetratricopeptide repeat protein [Ignavibacteriota bacterium]